MDLNAFLTLAAGCAHEITTEYGLPLSLFIAGLVGGASHCTAMCGPFVLSQTGNLSRLKDGILLPYHLGRITTYIAMAAFFSAALNLTFLFLPVRSLVIAPILMLSSLIFLISAFPSLGKIFPWATKIKFSLPYKWLSHTMGKLNSDQSAFQKYLMGILLGFMPCGLIVSALMAASTAPNIVQSGLAMAAFGAGTMPALIATAIGGQALKIRHPVFMKRVAQGMMLWSGLWLFALAGLLLI